MFNDKNKFVYFDEFTYYHYDTGNNVSFDIDNWRKSLKELEHNLYCIPDYPNKKVRKLKKLKVIWRRKFLIWKSIKKKLLFFVNMLLWKLILQLLR